MNRLLDILLILLTIPLTVPVGFVIAVFSLCVQGRPVFFVDLRAGKGGRPFRMVKFRTMRVGDGADGDRMTRFGCFLRRTSLDELPELWNVLKGEMALVGPRPLPVRYLPRYTPEQNRRHDVRPGITGLAQVNGRNALDWEEKFRYDIAYVNARPLVLDLRILFQTLGQVVCPRGIAHAGSATMPEFEGALSTGKGKS